MTSDHTSRGLPEHAARPVDQLVQCEVLSHELCEDKLAEYSLAGHLQRPSRHDPPRGEARLGRHPTADGRVLSDADFWSYRYVGRYPVDEGADEVQAYRWA